MTHPHPAPSPPRPAHRTPSLPTLLSTALLGLFLLLPVLALLLRGLGPEALPALRSAVVADALRVSLLSTLCTLALCLGLVTPVAWLLSRYEFRGKAVLDTLLDLPVVLPPVVAGVGLLLVFGRLGWVGAPLRLAGISLAFTPAAVVLAQLFVSAPFYLRAAKSGFAAVDRDLEGAAQTDGATRAQVFRLITWPLAFPFLLEGLVLTWARALGEFGATILFAGSLQGKTRTVPLAIYAAMESDLAPALALSAVMVLVAFGLLLAVRVVAGRR